MATNTHSLSEPAGCTAGRCVTAPPSGELPSISSLSSGRTEKPATERTRDSLSTECCDTCATFCASTGQTSACLAFSSYRDNEQARDVLGESRFQTGSRPLSQS